MKSGGDRTEKPTPKRLREARREGRVARTADLGAWAGLLVASYLLPSLVRHLADLFARLIGAVPAVTAHPDPGRALQLLHDGVVSALTTVLPLSVALLVTGLAVAVAQGGMRIATKRLKPDFKRLSPAKGVRRMFGAEGAWAAVKATAKLVLPAVVGYLHGHALVNATLGTADQPLSSVLATAAAAALSMLRAIAFAALGAALLEYAIERHRLAKSLRMTRHEVKEESRQSEGDPHMRSAIRSRQMAISRNRMIADVSTADVVVVNPTHVAVALRYDPARGAPRVVAKGADAVATRIREEADRHRVPMVEDVPLARALYRVCEIGTEIPAELYDAVARILAYIFSLRRRGVAGTSGVMRTGRPSNVPGELLMSRRRLPTRRAARTATRRATDGRPSTRQA